MTPQTTFANGISPWPAPPINPLRAAWSKADNSTLAFIASHPRCTVNAVAEAMGEPPHSIRNRLRRLTKAGKLRVTHVNVGSRMFNLMEVVQ